MAAFRKRFPNVAMRGFELRPQQILEGLREGRLDLGLISTNSGPGTGAFQWEPLRWPRMAWLHLPAVAWGVVVEWSGWICPLTPLESALRLRAGQQAYGGDFVQHYVLALIYPEGLTREIQIVLGAVVLALNLAVYVALYRRMRRQRTRQHA